MSFATYKFLPWARRGMSAYISESDTLGRADGDAIQRASVRLALEFNQAAELTETNDLSIIGPGDIVGIKSDMIIRTEPLDSVAGFEPNYLPYVEFYDEDFPWRYTPARAVDAEKGTMKDGVMRPWLALILLKANEFEDTKRRQPLPSIIVTNPAALPPHDELHLWAHAHSNISDGGNQTVLEDFLESLEENYKKDPDGLYSRILCPRRLEADTYYHAFVVPSYETGRLAGLGRPIKDTKAQKPAWGPNASDFELPVYHRWGFRTGLNFDFESLVRLLEPRVMDDKVGVRPMDVSAPEYPKATGSGKVSNVDPKIMYLEGALLAPQTKPDPLKLNLAQPFVTELKELVNLNISNAEKNDEDPIVTVPFYGMYHAMEVLNALPDFVPDDVQEAGKDITKWQNELNRDPRWRVAAGFGTRMVQENQEKFMDSAWKQLKNVLEANKKMQTAQLAAKVGNRMYDKHLAPLTQEKLLSITRAVSARVDALPLAVEKEALDPNALEAISIQGGPFFKQRPTAKSAINASPLPAAALSHPFRRAVRAKGKMMRGLEKAYIEEPVIKSAEAPTERAVAAFAVGFQAQMLQTAISELNGEKISAAPKIQFNQLGDLNKGDLSAGPLALQDIRVWSIKSNTDDDFIYNLPDFNGGLPGVSKWKFLFGPNVNKPNVVFEFDPVSNWNFLGGITKFSNIFKLGPLLPPAAPRDPAAPPPLSLDDAFGTMNQRKGYDVPSKFTVAAPLSTLADNTRITLKPSSAYRQMLRHQVRFGSLDNKVTEDFLPVMAYPDYPEPTYEYLVKIDKELLLPNLDLIPPNTLSLLRTNQKFIESYLVGINYEMGRELLWREYPTDMRGSYFRQFWDVSGIVAPETTAIGSEDAKDIKPIHTWLDKTNKEKWPLGRHNARDKQGDASQLVFVVRGELLKKYPNAVIFAQKAKKVNGKLVLKDDFPDTQFKDFVLFPQYKAEIAPDIKLFGFDLTIEEAAGEPRKDHPAEGNDGWFFVIAEVPGEPRFGMDLTYNEGNEETWDDISWQNFEEPLDFVRANKIPGNAGPRPEQEFNKNQSLNGPKGHWARSSADMANILFQRPVMIAVHATEMLDEDVIDNNLALNDTINLPNIDPKLKPTLKNHTIRGLKNLTQP